MQISKTAAAAAAAAVAPNSGQENEVLATKSFEEVDTYLQGHIPPSRSKELEDVFDGETTLVFKAP